MKLNKKIKSYGFWISLTMAIIVVLKTLGDTFSFTVNEEVIISIVTSIIGVFVVLGLVHKKDSNKEVESPSSSEITKVEIDKEQ